MVTTERDLLAWPVSDLVDRNFYADAPNVFWVADITYVPTWAGCLYLSVVLDAFSRSIIGWAMGNDQKAQPVIHAMNMTVAQRKVDSVIHHIEQGSQYRSVAFGLRCKEMGVRLSMGSVGDCHDNSVCESFFATLECELLDRRKFKKTKLKRGLPASSSSKAGTTPRAGIRLRLQVTHQLR